LKEDKAIAYSIFFKSAFPELWEKAQIFHKAGKLSSSFEIWCPPEKKKHNPDGTYALMAMEIAGGALIFEEKGEEPAFKDAKVLEMAKSWINEEHLVCATKYQNKELITSEGEIIQQTQTDNRTKPESTKITCSNCSHQFDYVIKPGITSQNIKCPNCKAILDQKGQMFYPPQIIDFKALCPSCKVKNWIILSSQEDKVNVQCLQCKKKYEFTFAKNLDKRTEFLTKHINFVYSTTLSCPQCGNRIPYSGIKGKGQEIIKCKECKLEFPFNFENSKRYKQIIKITPLEEAKKEKKGGQNMKFKLEISKYHRYVDDFESLFKEISSYDEIMEAGEKAVRLTYQQRQRLPDRMFAVVKRVKDKRTGKTRKIRMFPIHDEAHVRNALARLGQKAPQVTLRRMGISIEAVRKKILRRAKALGMTTLLKRYQKSSKDIIIDNEVAYILNWVNDDWKIEEQKVEKATAQEPEVKIVQDKSLVKAAIKKLREVKKQHREIKDSSAKRETLLKANIKKLADENKELEKQVELYKAHAKTIISRREELEDYATDLSDEDILNDDKFERARLEKELAGNRNKDDDIVGGSKVRDVDYYTRKREAIDERAFREPKSK
jgi:hypothetical protein